MARPLVVAVAGKGGEGKTLLSVNLSIALARAGGRVLYLDLDTGMGNHNPNWGLEVLWGLGDFWERGDLRSIARRVPLETGEDGRKPFLEILGGHAEFLPDRADPGHLADALAKGGWTHIVMDLGAGTKRQVFRFCHLADHLFLVSGPHPNALREAADIAGSAFVLKRKLPIVFFANRCRDDALPEVQVQFEKFLSEKFVSLDVGDRVEQGSLAKFLSRAKGNLFFWATGMPVFQGFLPGSKRLADLEKEGSFFKEVAAAVWKWQTGAKWDMGALLSRALRARPADPGTVPKRPSTLEPFRDFFRRSGERPSWVRALKRVRVFTSAKGGVGQTEALARMAVMTAGTIPQTLFDLNVEETSRHSSLGWYFGLRAPVALRTLWEKEGHTWPLDRKRKLELFFYRNRQGIESPLSFLEALGERLGEQVGGTKEVRAWLDGESGVEVQVMALGLLAGNITIFSDCRDGESLQKLKRWVGEWAKATEAFPEMSAHLRVVLTRCPPEPTAETTKRRGELYRVLLNELGSKGNEWFGRKGTSLYIFPEHPYMDGNWDRLKPSQEEKRLVTDLWG